MARPPLIVRIVAFAIVAMSAALAPLPAAAIDEYIQRAMDTPTTDYLAGTAAGQAYDPATKDWAGVSAYSRKARDSRSAAPTVVHLMMAVKLKMLSRWTQ